MCTSPPSALWPFAFHLPLSQEGWGTLLFPAGLSRHLALSIMSLVICSPSFCLSFDFSSSGRLAVTGLSHDQDVPDSSLEAFSQNLLLSSFTLHVVISLHLSLKSKAQDQTGFFYFPWTPRGCSLSPTQTSLPPNPISAFH